MQQSDQLDSLILGRRLRHIRKERGLTLDQLGEQVGKPAPYLSLLENGKRAPRLNLVVSLAGALGVELTELLEPTPPNRRDELEIALIRAQESALFEGLQLPPVKPSARVDDQTLEHLVGIHEALRERSGLTGAGSDDVRRANGGVSARLADCNGYLSDIEDAAREALQTSGYAGEGPFSSRNLIDLARHAGFTIHPIDDMPSFARSVIDLENGRIFIAQRNELRTRQARKAILQTIAGFVLDHEREPDLDTFLMQRMETAYFAAAVLVPEDRVIARMSEARAEHDLDVEDVKELFYVSYEMAAWRSVNLLTHHFGVASHLFVSDAVGSVVKAYANDDVPAPKDAFGGMETQILCKRWGARKTFESPDKFGTHHQYTDTPSGTFFCTTHVEAGRDPAFAVTLGVGFADARWFRGRDTASRESSTCPDPACCQLADADLTDRWAPRIVVSARAQDRILGLMAPDPYPTLDLPAVLAVVDGHSPRA